MNLPNKLTITRMVLTPVFVACFYIPVSWSMYLAGALFVIAYLTDMLDGQIARRMNIVTDFGKLMDPIADKILSAAAMIMLTAVQIAVYAKIGQALGNILSIRIYNVAHKQFRTYGNKLC